MGSDGSLGLKAIKEKNGIVLVQDPVTARFDGMPNSAIQSVNADIVAPAEELPGKLVSFLSIAPAAKTDSEIEVKTRSNIEKIIILLREKTGHDFSMYKKSTLLRRIERRKEVHQIDRIHNYVRFLQENPKELEILFKEMLIGVTNFFRDNQVWVELRDNVIPEMLNRLPDGFVMRAWVPGCSTGEEAYSLAIVFKESIEKLKIHKNISLQIFATDLDKDAIEKARRGFFSKKISADVSHERLERFFTPEEVGFHISSSIREMVVFAPQDVIKDPPFTKLQILTCRNMLIYMEPELQNRLIGLFSYSLDPGGILVLGSAETMGNHYPGFEDLNPKLKIFKHSAQYSTSEIMGFSSTFQNPGSRVSKKTVPTKIVDNIQTIADQLLLKYFSPASVLVNSKGDIIYITGKTGKYLEPVAGKANWNIYYMAREGLQNEMPGAFRKALQNYEPVILRNVKIETSGEAHFVDVTLQRIESPESVKDMILIVFTDVPAVLKKEVLSSKLHKTRSGSHHTELELELQRSFEETKSIREEMQTSQEELKSTNEELQSTNEELQTTNEELTTPGRRCRA
jgi:two-component system CheB/CheR fusion protein